MQLHDVNDANQSHDRADSSAVSSQLTSRHRSCKRPWNSSIRSWKLRPIFIKCVAYRSIQWLVGIDRRLKWQPRRMTRSKNQIHQSTIAESIRLIHLHRFFDNNKNDHFRSKAFVDIFIIFIFIFNNNNKTNQSAANSKYQVLASSSSLQLKRHQRNQRNH